MLGPKPLTEFASVQILHRGVAPEVLPPGNTVIVGRPEDEFEHRPVWCHVPACPVPESRLRVTSVREARIERLPWVGGSTVFGILTIILPHIANRLHEGVGVGYLAYGSVTLLGALGMAGVAARLQGIQPDHSIDPLDGKRWPGHHLRIRPIGLD